MSQEHGSQESPLQPPTPSLLHKGYYLTRGGYHARLDKDIVRGGLGVVREVGYVAYNVDGKFAYKESFFGHDDDPGDSLDILVETWQFQPFVKAQEEKQ